MSDRAVRPVAVNGLTTATNATVGATAAGIVIPGNTVMISVGILAAFPIYIMFGKEGVASTLTSTTGFKLPAGFVGRISAPMGSTHLYHLRAGASDSDISVLGCDGGV
jgi:hypothetical protein